MKRILGLLFLLVIFAASSFAVPYPKIYLPFEGTDGYYDQYDPAWINRAPGLYDQMWYAEKGRLGTNSNVPGMMPVIAVGSGVDGSDCMDLTAASAKQLGTVYYGNLPNTADAWFSNTPAEDAFDNAMSFTISGWFKTVDDQTAIGSGDQLGERMFNKYGQVQVLCNSGRFGIYIGNGASWVYSDWGSYSQADHKGNWTYFAITYDGSVSEGNNMKFYVGTSDSVVTQVSEGSTGTVRGAITWTLGQYFIVGNYGVGSTHGQSAFKGMLDNIRVFSEYDDGSGALGLNDLELYRQIDLGITAADDSQIYFTSDINQDYEVGSGDLAILAAQWLDNAPPAMPEPAIHLTFDGTDGVPYDENDPAFANQGIAGTGELPSMIMRIPVSDPNYAEYPDGISFAVTDDAVKGGALDLSERGFNSLGSMLVYGNTDSQLTDTAMQQALDWPLSLTFTCWWKHSQAGAIEVAEEESPAHLLHAMGELSFFANRRTQPAAGFFGEIGFTPNDDDEYSGNMIYSPWMYPETDQWVFFACTIDMLLDQSDASVGRIKWYRGTINQPVTLHTQVQFPLDEIMAAPAGNPLVIGNVSYLENDAVANFGAIIDELRLYASDTDSSAALSVDELENIRKNDAVAYVKKQADINKDDSVDLGDYSDIADQWLDSKTPFEMLPYDPANALIYLPFENDNGSYGLGSIDNPAWLNAANSEAPIYVGNSTPTAWPEITTDGISGDAFYASDSTKTGLSTMTINWTGSTMNAFSQVQAYTVTGWINTRDASQNGSESYLLRSWGGGINVKWRGDGRLQVIDTVDNTWRYAGWNEGYSNGDWVFFAIVRDDSSIRFYFGDETNAVTAGNAITGLTLANTADCTRFILGGTTYNGTDTYVNADMDEIRVFSSKTDNSGALSIEDLEDLREYDLGL